LPVSGLIATVEHEYRLSPGRVWLFHGAGLPVHLETATESNLSFYAARGFEVVGEAR
jgi:hypothetical protein